MRIQWFWLQARTFVQRHQMGLMVLVFFLPGVAITQNLTLVFQALATPIIRITSQPHSGVGWVGMAVLTQAVMLVWASTQKTAINGGSFAQHMDSWPLSSNKRQGVNTIMLLLGNHLLWPLWLAPWLFADFEGFSFWQYLLFLGQWLGLLMLCLCGQWLRVYEHPRWLLWVWAGLWLLVVIMPFLAGLLLIGLACLWPQPKWLEPQFKVRSHGVFKNLGVRLRYPSALYWHMLFKAQPAMVFSRLLFCAFAMYGFVWQLDHFAGLNQGDWLPYAIVMEGVVAYFSSVLFVLFRDQRATWQDWLSTMPLGRLYWFSKDYMVLSVWAMILHLPLFLIWGVSAVGYLLYQLLLLLLLYPVRKSSQPIQTFHAFVMILFVTIIAVFLI